MSSDKKGTSPWLGTLLILTVIQSSVFISFSILQFDALSDVEDLDQDLKIKLDKLNTANGREKRNAKDKRFLGILTDLLQSQEKILAQHCVHKDSPCPRGNSGAKGQAGIQGEKGKQGLFGTKGEQGIPGPSGLQGDPGLDGPIGLKGEHGMIGERGLKGNPGQKGDPGLKGIKGTQGFTGLQGEKGEGGLSGIKGMTGPPGEKGDVGDGGPQGVKGNIGIKGSRGPQGNAGESVSDDCECFRAPKFTKPSTEYVYAAAGESRTIPCFASGNPIPTLTVTTTDQSVRSIEENDGKFVNLKTSDTGVYKCVASNTFGSAEKLINVTVGAKPKMTNTPSDLSLSTGITLEQNCGANGGTPSPVITFYHAGQKITTSTHFLVTNGRLTIRSTRQSDSGTYYCTASNIFGTVTSPTWQLTIT